MRILAVDPGGTTGIATWEDGAHKAWAVPFDEAIQQVHGFIGGYGPGGLPWRLDLVVFESIVITGKTLQKSRDVQDAIEFIGVGRYLCRCYGVEFITQKPSEAFSFGTDAKIKAMGWECPGPGDHTKSASKHLLLTLVNRRLIDLAALAAAVG